jgi:DNA replication protein DnaD
MDLNCYDLDWRKLLVKHYKYYGLNENDLAVILCLFDILTPNQSLIGADDLVSYMTISKDDIDKSLVKLLDKKFIEYIQLNGKTVTSLSPLYARILSDLKKDVVIESNENQHKADQSQVNSLYSYFEETLGRTLTGRETDRISFWLRTGADEKMIKEAVEKLKAQSKTISLAAVDKILLSLQKSDDISKEGFSSRRENWREGSQETIDILSKRWVPKD